jgi:hypothetical protein
MKHLIQALNTATFIGILLTASPVHAVFVSVTPTDSPLTLDGAISGNSGKENPITVTYSPSPATEIWFSNNANGSSGDVGAQSPNNVLAVTKSVFGLTSGSLYAGNAGDFSGNFASFSFSSADFAFDYLAIHAGQHELLFYFENAIDAGEIFTISIIGKAAGLSNFRTFSSFDPELGPSGAAVVPVPTALWLFSAGIMGLVGFRRKQA